jgi:hypothetical protein
MTMAVEDAHLVVEGTASIVRDEGAFSADYGAPTAGPPPYEVYALQPVTVYGFGTDETWSPTRWRFSLFVLGVTADIEEDRGPLFPHGPC